MKPVDLDDVERRRDCWDSGDAHAGGRLLSEDMPAILAECRRLREALEAYRTSHNIGRLVVAQGHECPCDDCKRAKEVLGG